MPYGESLCPLSDVVTSPVRTECGMFVMYAVAYVYVSCFVVSRCAVSRRYIYIYIYIYMFAIVIYLVLYLDHLKCCVVCINGRRYFCCG